MEHIFADFESFDAPNESTKLARTGNQAYHFFIVSKPIKIYTKMDI